MSPVIAEILSLAMQLAEEDGPQLVKALMDLFANKTRENAMKAALASADAAADVAEGAVVDTGAKLP